MNEYNQIEIQVAFGFDANYLPHFFVVLKQNQTFCKEHTVIAHVLHTEIPEDDICVINHSFPDIDIRWYSVDSSHPALALRPLLHISTATYLRLIMFEVIIDCPEKIIYLDIDIAINHDLAYLMKLDLGDHPIGAVDDHGLQPDDAHSFGKLHSIQKLDRYFNAGVLVINTTKCIENGIFKTALNMLMERPEDFPLADQDALNVACRGNWHRLPAKWNLQRALFYDNGKFKNTDAIKDKANPAIIHFTTRQKPWQRGEWHPYSWLYLKYLLESPFRNEVESKGEINFSTYIKSLIRYYLMIVKKKLNLVA